MTFMIPATQKKLRETKFFLALLEEEGRVPVMRAIEEHAEFYFSALVSAGRSVTFALQSEEKAKYDAWFPGWLTSRSETERLSLRRFNEERVKIVHRAGAELSSRNVLTPYRDFGAPSRYESKAYYIMTRMLYPESEMKIGTLQLICRYSDDTEAIAVDAAREYVAVLESLIDDFVRHFQCA
jgi:hypothetical protein